MCLAVPEPRVPLKLLTFGPLGPGTNSGLSSDANRLSVCLVWGTISLNLAFSPNRAFTGAFLAGHEYSKLL